MARFNLESPNQLSQRCALDDLIAWALAEITMKKQQSPASLKSASGGGFFFEDKVAALLLCEMLIGKQSLDKNWGVTQQLERQAGDWEPFGDLVLTVPNFAGKLVKCGCSVKSNQPVNTNGCRPDLRSGLWATMARQNFVRNEDALALFSSPLAQVPHKHLNALCEQARENDASRLEQKILHQNHQDARRIYDSFRHSTDKSQNGLPGHALAHLVSREFDFEDKTSRDEAEALRLCRELLSPDTATDNTTTDLPPAAHHHIEQFLNALLLEPLCTEPPRIAELRPIWREIAAFIFSTPKWLRGRSMNCQEVLSNFLLYGSSIASSGEEYWSPLVDDLRPHFKQYLDTLAHDAHEQSSFAHFLITKAGQRLLIDALVWLQPSWALASDWFWETAVEENHFSNLLEHAWRYNFADIRANPDALKAFKTLTLKLAAQQAPIALEVQQQI